MKGPLTDQVRINHVLDAISEVEGYLQYVSLEEFLTNSEKRFATIKQIEIIGEACNRISAEFKDAHPEIEWCSIIGFRNISIHQYFGINFQIVWEIARYDLPVLREHFSKSL
jgi:uncharacterized protein with HEPN domain